MLSIWKAKYVKYIIAHPVQHLLHSGHHCGLFIITYQANRVNVPKANICSPISNSETKAGVSERPNRVACEITKLLGHSPLRTQIALSHERLKCLHTELCRLQAYISHCVLLRAFTKSGFHQPPRPNPTPQFPFRGQQSSGLQFTNGPI